MVSRDEVEVVNTEAWWSCWKSVAAQQEVPIELSDDVGYHTLVCGSCHVDFGPGQQGM